MGCKPIFKTAKHHYFLCFPEGSLFGVETSPKGFTFGVKVEIEKIFSICFKVLINAELYGLVLASRLKKRIPLNLGRQFATLGANVPAFIDVLMSMF
jgi:hypothetical protein